MIDYELAKQLKDAGFPQKPVEQYDTADTLRCMYGMKSGQHWKPPLELDLDEYKIPKKYVYIPTLSELIETCGKYYQLKLIHHPIDGDKQWRAFVENNTDPHWEYETYGSTPEEAVAKLWLELNGKGKD